MVWLDRLRVRQFCIQATTIITFALSVLYRVSSTMPEEDPLRPKPYK